MRDGTVSCFPNSAQKQVICLDKNANANNHLGHLHLEQEKAGKLLCKRSPRILRQICFKRYQGFLKKKLLKLIP